MHAWFPRESARNVACTVVYEARLLNRHPCTVGWIFPHDSASVSNTFSCLNSGFLYAFLDVPLVSAIFSLAFWFLSVISVHTPPPGWATTKVMSSFAAKCITTMEFW